MVVCNVGDKCAANNMEIIDNRTNIVVVVVVVVVLLCVYLFSLLENAKHTHTHTHTNIRLCNSYETQTQIKQT